MNRIDIASLYECHTTYFNLVCVEPSCMISRAGRNAVNSICLAVNSSFFESHFVDLPGVFSVYLYSIDYLRQKNNLQPSVYLFMSRKAN